VEQWSKEAKNDRDSSNAIYRTAMLQCCRVAIESRRVVMCSEVSAGILFRERPHPYPYIDPSGKGGPVLKADEKNFPIQKFGVAVAKA
jgi:hypothetical protein